MYDLDKKLLDLNNQILSYRLAMNRSLDPTFANPMAPPIIQSSQSSVTDSISKPVEEKREEPVVVATESPAPKISRGPRGKRGKRGPKGEPGLSGKDFDPLSFLFNTNLITTNYSVCKNDCFVLIKAKEDITVVIPEGMQDGKLLIFKNDSDSEVVITIKSEDGGMIDGDYSVEMTRPNETLILICKGGDWFIL